MGAGSYDIGTYDAILGGKIASGTTFSYTKTMHSTSYADRKAHDSLDPKKVAGDASALAGMAIREARDSVDHPNALPIVVGFDVTGSMSNIPKVFIEKLRELFSLVIRKGYVEDPTILVAAIGDAYCDRVPLQLSQFESDNRIDDALDNIYLESGGGGGGQESYELFMWYMANRVHTDAFEKRGKKGYLFMIGDEHAYKELPVNLVEQFTGITGVQGPITLEQITKDLQEKWNVYVIVPLHGGYPAAAQAKYWEKYFDAANILVMQEEADIAELIAVVLGTEEGNIDLDEGIEDLKSIGSTSAVTSVGNALAKRAPKSGGKIIAVDVPTQLEVSENDDQTERI